eukprot:symbB.v1.2.020751.t1/scaffold1763.1/size102666/6
MVSAVPRRGEGGVNLPIADDLDDTLDSTYSQPAPSPQEEAAMAPSPYPSPNLAGLEVPDVIEPRPVLSDNFDVSTLCPGMILVHGTECAMAVPIPGEDITEASMTILDPANGEPLLKAEVFRGSECEAPPNFSPMIGDDWPPENYWPHSSDRGNQHPSILLTTLPMNIPRSDDEDDVNEDAGENVQNHSSCYLVHADEQSLEFDIYNGNGAFWGRMGRDHSRSCRFMMRGGNFGEVRYFVDGVFEDHAVLFTDMLQDTIADGEALELADLAFGEARSHGGLVIVSQADLTFVCVAVGPRLVENLLESLISVSPNMPEGDKVLLKSSQGEIFEVEPEVACMSTLVRNMVDDSGTDEEIPLPNVKTAILSKVIDYCKYHKDSPPEEIQKPLKSTNLVECGVSEWDNEYVNIEQEVLFELILAANYLDIKSLLDLTCAKVASMIKGKNTEEIRKQFNIVNDFTPEEEAQVREENRWCEDA